MSAWASHWFTPVDSIRVVLLRAGLLSLFALDAFLLMIHRGAILGVGGFNVSHVPAVSALDWLAEPRIFVALIVASGLLALVVALAGTSRLLAAAIMAFFTLAWLPSRLDSYQHHYFLSLVLFCLVFLPDVRAWTGRARPVIAWSFTLVGACTAVVYLFAAVAKLEPVWLSGAPLADLVAGGPAADLVAVAGALGIGEDALLRVAAAGAVVAELVLAAAYAAAPYLARGQGRTSRGLALGAWVVALGLHAGVELLAVQIGWFSAYMILLASVFLLPTSALRRVGRVVLAPVALVDGAAQRFASQGAGLGWLVGATLGALTALAGVGAWSDLPGLLVAAIGVDVALVGSLGVALRSQARAAAWRSVLALIGATVVLMACLSWSDVRFEYHADRGTTLGMLGDAEGALASHLRSERHATRDESAVHVRIGRALRTLGRADEASVRYERALEVDPSNADAHNDLGVIRQQHGDRPGALEAYRRAVESDPGHAEAQANLGLALWLEGDREQALVHYREAVRARPDWPAALTGATWLLLARPFVPAADAQEALRMARHARDVTGGRSPAVLEALAAAYATAGRFPAAVEAGEAALALRDSAPVDEWTTRMRADLARYREGRTCVRCGGPPP